MIQLQFLNYLLKTKDSSILSVNNLNEDFFSDYKNEYHNDTAAQTVDKVPHYCAGFFCIKCQNVQYLCGLSGIF